MSDEYKKLDVWNEAMALAREVYLTCQKFPGEEIYGLTSQIKKSAISVPSNIAEGSVRRAPKDFVRFINIARGSLAELETQLILAHNFGFIAEINLASLSQKINKISKMLVGLRKSMESVVEKNNNKPLTMNH